MEGLAASGAPFEYAEALFCLGQHEVVEVLNQVGVPAAHLGAESTLEHLMSCSISAYSSSLHTAHAHLNEAASILTFQLSSSRLNSPKAPFTSQQEGEGATAKNPGSQTWLKKNGRLFQVC
eukprot:TRINITY_DN3968_c0_g1_i4.p1 TRINITY_DN3968_c0_g1~~TRINITY_DN3968_c0_g1_i4.p1  ORF type:complete len:136 (-),score=20.80 TRINITY_DN3968_c0_g1_i4:278-640(-)